MKTYISKKTSFGTIVAAFVFSIVLATQSVVNTATAQMATDNTKKEMNTLLQSITKEVDRRQTVLDDSTGGTEKTGDKDKTDKTDKGAECKEVPKSLSDGSEKEVKDQETALSSFESSLKNVKTTDEAKTKAKEADAEYEKFQITTTKAAILEDVCTQSDALGQLNTLLEQAKEQQASQSQSGSSGSSGSSGGGSSIDTEEIISMVAQLAVAIAAIIASVVALIQAIQNGDYAAAITIFQTILGQLTIVASILVQAISSLLGLEVSFSASAGTSS